MIKVNRERLWARMQELGHYGEADDPNLGVTRYAYSDIYRKAADRLISWMQEAGMKTRIDAAGNIYGRLEGLENGPVVLTGSHLDTVPNGGYYDGLAGIIAGLEVVTCIHENNIKVKYPIELVAFANEEACQFLGGTMGSRAIVGSLPLDHPQKTFDVNGCSLYDAMLSFGATPDYLHLAKRLSGDIWALYELHIEQAKLLEQNNCGVGIVTHIAGIHQLILTFYGISDHCGGTPMNQRHDALAAAAQIAVWLENTAICSETNTRGTVGYIKAIPGVHNIIANTAELSIDIREVDPEVRKKIIDSLVQKIEQLCQERGLTYHLEYKLDAKPVLSDSRIINIHRNSAFQQDIPVIDIVSYAAHDSMIMADICPVGMIFLRCKNGLSHCPQELITVEDLEDGSNVLLSSVLFTAQHGL